MESRFVYLPRSNPSDLPAIGSRFCFPFPFLRRFSIDWGENIFATLSCARLSGDSARFVNRFPIFFVPLLIAFPNDFSPAFCSVIENESQILHCEVRLIGNTRKVYLLKRNKEKDEPFECSTDSPPWWTRAPSPTGVLQKPRLTSKRSGESSPSE